MKGTEKVNFPKDMTDTNFPTRIAPNIKFLHTAINNNLRYASRQSWFLLRVVVKYSDVSITFTASILRVKMYAPP